jgi:very-short-patch-repair endonuclease
LRSNPGEGPGNAWRQPEALNDVSEASRQSDGRRNQALVRSPQSTTLWAEVCQAGTVGRYTCDFVCRERKVVVEVDGGQHAESKSDAVRDRYLRERGYRVIRFWNNDVLSNLDGVRESLAAQLNEDAGP